MNIRTKPQVNVAQPCHENWNQMTPEAQGRFCGSCSKIVVDFTNMTDHEVIAFFEQSKGKTCGRFTKDQLARPLEKELNKPIIFYQKWLIAAVLSGILALSPETNNAKTPPAIDEVKAEMVHGGVRYIHAYPEFIEFEGVVTHQGKPLARVAIYIVATDSYVFTRKDGTYSFKMKTYDYRTNGLATFSKKGYEDLYRHLEVVKANGAIELELAEKEADEIVVPQAIEVQKDSNSNNTEQQDSTEVTTVLGADGILQPSEAFEIIYERPWIEPGISGMAIYTPATPMPGYDIIEQTKAMFRYLFK